MGETRPNQPSLLFDDTIILASSPRLACLFIDTTDEAKPTLLSLTFHQHHGLSQDHPS